MKTIHFKVDHNGPDLADDVTEKVLPPKLASRPLADYRIGNKYIKRGSSQIISNWCNLMSLTSTTPFNVLFTDGILVWRMNGVRQWVYESDVSLAVKIEAERTDVDIQFAISRDDNDGLPIMFPPEAGADEINLVISTANAELGLDSQGYLTYSDPDDDGLFELSTTEDGYLEMQHTLPVAEGQALSIDDQGYLVVNF